MPTCRSQWLASSKNLPLMDTYPTWALDVKISLDFLGILPILSPPADQEAAFIDTFKYQAIFIIQNHLHPD
jgi:hypothetical protein